MAAKRPKKTFKLFGENKPSAYLVLLTLMMVIIGLGSTLVYHTSVDQKLSIHRRITTPENLEKEKNKIRNFKEQNAQLADKNELIRQRIHYFAGIEAILYGELSESDVEKTFEDLLFTYRNLNGAVGVQGEGVIILMRDGENEGGLIHNTDLLAVLNDLRFAGAEALAVNGYPISAGSAVNCAGPIITIDGRRTVAPVRIEAIGDAEALNFYLNSDESVLRILKSKGIKVNIDKSEIIFIGDKR